MILCYFIACLLFASIASSGSPCIAESADSGRADRQQIGQVFSGQDQAANSQNQDAWPSGKDANQYAESERHMRRGSVSQARGDLKSGLANMKAELRIKDDPRRRETLGDIYRVRGEDDLAVVQYKAAARLKDSAAIEIKLAQIFLTKKMKGKAQSALHKAEALPRHNWDEENALINCRRDAR